MGKAQRNRARSTGNVMRGVGERPRGSTRPPDEPGDPHLPEFSVRQADALRRHCADAVRSLGFRAKDLGTHIAVMGGPFTGAGAQLGFRAIATEARQLPESEWGAMAEAIVRQVIGAAVQGSTAPGSIGYAGPALRERLFPRFVAPDRMPPHQLIEDYTYAKDVAGLPLIMAIRREQASMLLSDVHLAKAGGLEAAWDAAEENLFSAGLGEAQAFMKDGTAVLLLESEHPQQASWLAYPERLMEHFGIEPGPLGVFFGVPALRMITFSVIEESMTLNGVESMLELNSILGQDELAPLSPHVYWWRPGDPVRPATSFEDGHLTLTLPQTTTERTAGAGGNAEEAA
ncbi:hypothetical protein GCM10027449_12780 [Sinomonas notoginsengisoli]|uniref:hypothetical protein n=1 Tax=Sinomonas notoginsengisoli TaxID=1457311 RepID=UPI001F1599CA|nr:hypothetical protein [Sinomonas notoginsengisoli]